jgi:ABC-type nitrate/sulfonate/bicarbonate transport system permease component
MRSKVGAASTRLVPPLFVVAMLLAWQLIGAERIVSPLFLPPLGAVASSLFVLVRTSAFWSAAATTLRTIVEAYLLCVAAGLCLGYVVTRSRFLTVVIEPIVSGLFAVPITLFFPLFILFFGIGPPSKVAYGACYAFFPVALSTIAAFSTADERLLRAARAMGLSRFGVFRHLLLPSAFPFIVTGLRVAFFICFASVLGGETISSISGVGHNISLEAELMEPARMYAWIVVVVVVSLALNAILSLADDRRRGA